MRILALILLLSGCALNTPISQFDAGVSDLCDGGEQSYTHGGVTKTFTVYPLDSTDDIYTHCGPDAKACLIMGEVMYVPSGPGCAKSVAHELNHGFGNHWVDRPKVGGA